jgi:hypothetical protein
MNSLLVKAPGQCGQKTKVVLNTTMELEESNFTEFTPLFLFKAKTQEISLECTSEMPMHSLLY